MGTKWKPDTIYFCGEFNQQTGTITEPILVMFSETELRANWREGKSVIIHNQEFVSLNREVDRKTGMVTYQLKQIIEPSPLQL